MRVDKYLKVSRVLKRRTVAKELADNGRIKINDKVAKAGHEVEIGDVIEITFGHRQLTIKVTDIKHQVRKSDEALFSIVSETNLS